MAATSGHHQGVVALLLLYNYVYNLTIGATAFSLSAEVATARLRAKTASLTFALQGSAVLNVGTCASVPVQSGQSESGGEGDVHLWWLLNTVDHIYLWFYQPEVAGRSYEKPDEMFSEKSAGEEVQDLSAWRIREGGLSLGEPR